MKVLTYMQMQGGTQPGKLFPRFTVKCDICDTRNLKVFIDGVTKSGTWANMCLSCHHEYGRGLGVGRGQSYQIHEGDE